MTKVHIGIVLKVRTARDTRNKQLANNQYNVSVVEDET